MKAINSSLREAESQSVYSQLFNTPEWLEAKVVAVTYSNHPELDTKPIIKAAWDQGKRIALPRTMAKRKLAFFYHTDASKLETSSFGIEEPIHDASNQVPLSEIDLMIVPGVAFTNTNHRIGFGGGYYDRLLAGFAGPTISLAFSAQKIEQTDYQVESHDIPVGRIIFPGGQADV